MRIKRKHNLKGDIVDIKDPKKDFPLITREINTLLQKDKILEKKIDKILDIEYYEITPYDKNCLKILSMDQLEVRMTLKKKYNITPYDDMKKSIKPFYKNKEKYNDKKIL